MAAKYFLNRDFSDTSESDECISISPHWVLGFARYANPITYDPAKRASTTDDRSYAYQERDVLVVDDLGDCVSLTIDAQKDAHTMSLQANFIDSGTKYLNEILPGDWMVAYIVYSLDEAQAISMALARGRKMNHWHSGLKFLGRVQAVQKQVQVSARGAIQSIYSVSGVAFSEFDSAIMYYPQQTFTQDIAPSMAGFGLSVHNMMTTASVESGGGFDTNVLIPDVMQAIFGRGAWSALGQASNTSQPIAPNLAYIVPRTVCRWLGLEGDHGTFADLMRILIGIQKYATPERASNVTVEPGRLFWPDKAVSKDNAYRCPLPVMGVFPAEVIPQTNTTPWAFMSNYFGQPINESLVSLRSDQQGDIYPFLTLRQSPYTSELGRAFDRSTFGAILDSESQKDDNSSGQQDRRLVGDITPVQSDEQSNNALARRPSTRFLELPRWVVSSSMVIQSSLGRTDLSRQNMVFVYGSGIGVMGKEEMQFVLARPIVDNLDILRNGIRPYTPSVNCYLYTPQKIPADWRDIMADIVMGQHLTLSGSLMVVGIRSPIAPGDNVEFDGVVYHIQGVNHSCSIGAEGMRQFYTRLSLARGTVDTSETLRDQNGVEARAGSFPNVKSIDPEGAAIGITRD